MTSDCALFRPYRLVRRLPLVVASVCLLVPGALHAQVGPEQSLKSLRVPDGFEIGLFAAEPMVTNPTAIDIDSRGRVWVCEGQWYRAKAKNPPADRIKVLEDTDGDGRGDRVTVFADGLLVPMSVCVAGDKVYVGESPNLWVFQDKNGDLKADGPPRKLLSGFGGHNHDHGLHSLLVGPDHKLYMTQGDSGYDVTGPDGRHIQFRWGGMIRSELDGTRLEDFAVNFRNPYELAVDSFGNVWCSDNDNDGLKSVRICWILEGGNYGWFGRPEMIRNRDGSFDPMHHWRADMPGYVPHVLITGFGSPCGMTFYESGRFGAAYLNQLLHADAGPREVRCYHVEPAGAGYRARAENVVTTTSDNYFRPDDVCVAPDGSIFVSDWYDQGVGGHAYNNPEQGRIYRLRPKRTAGAPAINPGPYASLGDAIEALGSPNLATQFLARERILAAGRDAVPALRELLRGDDRILKARTIWLLDRIGSPDARQLVAGFLGDRDADFRALAVRILRRHGERSAEAVLAMAGDPSPAVRREVLIAIRSLPGTAATQAAGKLLDAWDGQDRFYLEAIGIAAHGVPGRADALFQRFAEGPHATLDERLIGLVRILRRDSSAAYLAERLGAGNLPAATEQAIVEALAASSEPAAGRAVAGLLGRGVPIERKEAALAALRRNLLGAWDSLRGDDALQQGLAAALREPAVQRSALELIGDARLKEALPNVRQVAESDTTPELARARAVEVLGRLGSRDSAPAIRKALSSPSDRLRTAAIRALLALGDTATLRAVLTSNDHPAALKAEAIRLMVQSTPGCLVLLPLVDEKKLPEPLARQVVAATAVHPDVNVRLLFHKFVPESERPETLGQAFQAADILKRNGNAERGRQIFLQSSAAACLKCHMVRGQGGDIGPELSQIGRKYDRAALLETILRPSAAIAPEYVPHLVETAAGQVFAGFIREDSARRLVLRTAEGELVSVPKGEVIQLAPQKVSLMPELVLGTLTAQDAADLLEYLAGLQEAVQTITSWWVLGPFYNRNDEGLDDDFGPDQAPGRIDLGGRHRGLGNQDVGWRQISTAPYGETQGVDINQLCRDRGARTDQVVFYFATAIDSPDDQPAQLLVGSDDGVRIWLNGEPVHKNHRHRVARFGDDTVAVRLRRGRNVLLVKVEQGDGPAGLIAAVAAKSTVTFGSP